MDKTALVEDDIALGRKATEGLLQDRSLNLCAALWLYVADAGEWRLVIATPLVEKDGPLKTYATIRKLLKRLRLTDRLPLRKVSAVSPKDPLVKTLRAFVQIGPGGRGARLTNNTINNVLIEDAYVYLMR